jgi:hypothetical protein
MPVSQFDKVSNQLTRGVAGALDCRNG